VHDDDPEVELDAVQNAEVLAGAERYYRAMVAADESSWNVRDCHMVDTLERLMAHHGPGAKAIVWEHNTSVGDARCARASPPLPSPAGACWQTRSARPARSTRGRRRSARPPCHTPTASSSRG
jgi:erythromycin esterase-like protein